MITIRQETQNDYSKVFELTVKAFEKLEISDHTEQFLVERLRGSAGFIPELSLVAEDNEQIVGHILLTEIAIAGPEKRTTTLILAPVSVLPDCQRQGIGSKLIQHAHSRASELGYNSVIHIGHPDYYPRFGYKKLSGYGISVPFEAPDECCLGIELTDGAFTEAAGRVEFPPEFTNV